MKATLYERTKEIRFFAIAKITQTDNQWQVTAKSRDEKKEHRFPRTCNGILKLQEYCFCMGVNFTSVIDLDNGIYSITDIRGNW